MRNKLKRMLTSMFLLMTMLSLALGTPIAGMDVSAFRVTEDGGYESDQDDDYLTDKDRAKIRSAESERFSKLTKTRATTNIKN